MSLLLGFTNWKLICDNSEIQLENRMPFYKSESGLWQSWTTDLKHDSVLQVYIRTVTKLNHRSKTWFCFSGPKQICAKTEIQIFLSTCKTLLFQMNFLGNKMESHLLHICFQTLWNRHEPRFCNRHVCYQGWFSFTRLNPVCETVYLQVCITRELRTLRNNDFKGPHWFWYVSQTMRTDPKQGLLQGCVPPASICLIK